MMDHLITTIRFIVEYSSFLFVFVNEITYEYTSHQLPNLHAGETCVALRAAERDYTEFIVPLTHHGEQTGMLTGGIQLRTSEGKLTEKLYGK